MRAGFGRHLPEHRCSVPRSHRGLTVLYIVDMLVCVRSSWSKLPCVTIQGRNVMLESSLRDQVTFSAADSMQLPFDN